MAAASLSTVAVTARLSILDSNKCRNFNWVPTRDRCALQGQRSKLCLRRRGSIAVQAKSDDPKDTKTTTQDKKEETVGDLKKSEEFRKFKANPSIEAALKVEKQLTQQRLNQIDSEDQQGFVRGLLSKAVRSAVVREQQRLEEAEGVFKALDLNKLKECFNYNTFYATDVRRFGDGGIFVGNLRKPLVDVKPELEARLTEAAGREIDLWFMQEPSPDGLKQVCVVQPKAEVDLQLSKQNNLYGYLAAAGLGVATIVSVCLMSGLFLSPQASFEDFEARALPLAAGFLTIFAVSEVSTRLTARHYGVTLSPTYLIPSNWTGCLGAVNNYESLLPSKKALFDVSAARATSAYVASLLLVATAFVLDKDLAGGDNALYIRPEFFINNPLLSFVQYAIGPYTDELGNVLPQAVEGLGVPLDPLAFAGLLGMVVTSLNLLPAGRLEGGRIAQAMVGRGRAGYLSLGTTFTLGAFGFGGSVLSLSWALFVTFFRRGEELPAQDEISELGAGRFVWGSVLALLCFLTLFPNSAGTFPSVFYTPPFWRNDF